MKCVVKNCGNEQKSKENKISFFLFPKNKELLKKWLKFCGNNKPFKEKTWRICMEHFKDEDIQGGMQFKMGFNCMRKLEPGAVPCIKLNKEANAQQRLKRLQQRSKKKIVTALLQKVDESDDTPASAELSDASDLADTMEIDFGSENKSQDNFGQTVNYLKEQATILNDKIKSLQSENKYLKDCLCKKEYEVEELKQSLLAAEIVQNTYKIKRELNDIMNQ